ncbi:MAG: hypothetical protein ABSB97_03660 [Thermoplasmata archaeon]|jgi:hypothetical protein
MPLFAFVGRLQPNKTTEFRQFIADLNGSRKKEYEDSRKKAGFRQEAMFLQKSPMGDMVVLIQDAKDEAAALTALRGMTDSFHVWYFQRMKDIHGIDFTGPALPSNELLLDYRSKD